MSNQDDQLFLRGVFLDLRAPICDAKIKVIAAVTIVKVIKTWTTPMEHYCCSDASAPDTDVYFLIQNSDDRYYVTDGTNFVECITLTHSRLSQHNTVPTITINGKPMLIQLFKSTSRLNSINADVMLEAVRRYASEQ